MKENLIVTLPLRVEPFTEDFTGQLSWGVLGNLLLRISEIHATSNGFGYEHLTKENKAWVLSRLTIAIDERPKTYEEFSLSTWVTNYFRQFTTRQYELRHSSGAPLGYASSTWAMIDTETRAPYNIELFDTKGVFSECLVDTEVPLKESSRIRLKTKEPMRVYKAAYSDLDINGHVNSIRYLQLMLDLFPKEVYEYQNLIRIDLAYVKEAYCGEELGFLLEEQEGGTFVVQIINKEGEALVKGLLAFQKKQ